MKMCDTCKLMKPLTDYHKGKIYKDGHRPKCKKCVSIYTKARYAKMTKGSTFIINDLEKSKIKIEPVDVVALDFSKNPKLESIIKITCDYYSVNYEYFCKNYKRNYRELVQIRQFVMWMYKINTGYSLAVIGGFFNKDHATVISSAKVIDGNRIRATRIKKDTDNLVRLVQAEFPDFDEPKLPDIIEELPTPAIEPTYTQIQILGMVKDCMGGVGVYRMLQGCQGDLSNYIKPAE